MILLLSGCTSTLTINEDITNKEIIKKGLYYYTKEQNIRIKVHDIKYEYLIGDLCESYDVVALAVTCYPRKSMKDILHTLYDEQTATSNTNFLFMVWPKKKIYKKELNGFPYAMKWIDKNIFVQMNLEGKETLVINKYGKIIKKVDYVIINESEYKEKALPEIPIN